MKKGKKEGRMHGREGESTEERKREWTEERKKERNEKRRKGEKERTGIWEGVKTTPSDSKEPVIIILEKKLDADLKAFSHK